MNNTGEVIEIEADILQTTSELRERFPTAYQLLSETPPFLRAQDSRIRMHDLRDYLETIQLQLADTIVDGGIRNAKLI